MHLAYTPEQQAFRAIYDGLAARNGNKALAHLMPPRLRVVLTENFGIKLPGPAQARAVGHRHLLQRAPRNEVGDEYHLR